MLELDHVFVCVSNELDLDNIATEFGLNLSTKQIHQGQGTASKCAFFDNAYLEFLFPDNVKELQSNLVQPLSLWERIQWKDTGASPFGVSFRFIRNTEQNIPVPTWSYNAPFLPRGATIPIVTPPNSMYEPLLFISKVTKAPCERNLSNPLLLEHRGSKHRLTKVKINTTSNPKLSEEVQWFCSRNLIFITKGTENHVYLEWDVGKEGMTINLKPIPISIRW
ncbi:VOC family protein [Pleurocapsa sp. PCC 7319]|uniref:VOC family protein n=1 Tax=Pleurocapsa sp. PCC 7319 TaxID=118161 RepID=UPI0003452809|nr:VOC family protein [Pleurocapsa sp. PCC 7319]